MLFLLCWEPRPLGHFANRNWISELPGRRLLSCSYLLGEREGGKESWSQTEVLWCSSRAENRLQEFWPLETWMVARKAFTKKKCNLYEQQVSTLASSGSLAAGSDLLVLSWQICSVYEYQSHDFDAFPCSVLSTVCCSGWHRFITFPWISVWGQGSEMCHCYKCFLTHVTAGCLLACITRGKFCSFR